MHQPRRSKNQRTSLPASKARKRTRSVEAPDSFETRYPAIAEWILSDGWIEIGQDDYRRSMVRALDAGGMVWEGKSKYPSLDELWRDLENGLIAWLEENG